MKVKNYLWSETDNMTTCIDERLRKASWIRKTEEKTSSRTVTKCIRNINRLTNTNWAKFEKQQLERNVYQNRWKLIWDSLIKNKET